MQTGPIALFRPVTPLCSNRRRWSYIPTIIPSKNNFVRMSIMLRVWAICSLHNALVAGKVGCESSAASHSRYGATGASLGQPPGLRRRMPCRSLLGRCIALHGIWLQLWVPGLGCTSIVFQVPFSMSFRVRIASGNIDRSKMAYASGRSVSIVSVSRGFLTSVAHPGGPSSRRFVLARQAHSIEL